MAAENNPVPSKSLWLGETSKGYSKRKNFSLWWVKVIKNIKFYLGFSTFKKVRTGILLKFLSNRSLLKLELKDKLFLKFTHFLNKWHYTLYKDVHTSTMRNLPSSGKLRGLGTLVPWKQTIQLP